ncbi:MAG TPA: ThuA domain-containing protein [Chitinophagaceae bacterium]|nr:ThuA domain-containing protein [Chitinophagaceae bacterium]MCB9056079.1 ThuA domain-containing protein [Chitinophagales bacterium]HPG12679.1 ThuA domain-containing protein [Chitinophagaceae bacterium]
MKKLKFIPALLAFLLIKNTTLSAQQFKALLVTETRGWHHESIPDGVAAIKQLAVKNFFDVTWYQEARKMTDKSLQEYQVIIFLNTTGDILDSNEQKAIEKFIQSGKGFVGVHSAADTEHGWEWYTKLIGRMFYVHPTIQTAKLKLTDNKFPGLQGFIGDPLWTDEWYEFGPEKVNDLVYILAVDESTYDPKTDWGPNRKGRGMGNFHPIAWYHNYDGGRSFYTNIGHMPTDFTSNTFLDHLYAGIFWAATGKK